jgi:hypothetical protein
MTKFSFSQNPILFSSLHKISATQDCVVNDPNLVFHGDSMLKELEESCNENESFKINIVGFRSHETLMLWVKEWHFYKSCKENNSFEMNIKTLWHEVSNNMTDGHSQPTPTIAPSTGCLLLLSCGWTSTELKFGFTVVTNSVGNRSHT